MKTITMKKLYVIFFLISINYSTSQSFSINGKIVDSESNPLPFMNVLVNDENGDYVNIGGISSIEGDFNLLNIPVGGYIIKISGLGFETKTITDIKISKNQPSINLGIISMADSSFELKGVDLFADKPILERKIDRSVLNISSIISASGRSIFDVLEQTPGIVTDRENLTLSMMGKDGIRIMINGRMNYLTGDAIGSYLNGINADSVEKIELITTPPSRFDADGNAGYINIILKKQLEKGFNFSGNISNGYDVRTVGNTSINFNYVGEKTRFFSNYSFNYRLNSFPILIEREFFGESLRKGQEIIIERNTNVNTHNLILGLERDFSDKLVIGTNLTLYKTQNFVDVKYDYFTENDNVNFDEQDRNGNAKWENIQLNSFLNFKPNDNLTIDVGFDYLNYLNSHPLTYDVKINYNQDPTEHKITTNKESPFEIVLSNVDFEKKFNLDSKINYGGKIIISNFENDQNVIRDGIKLDDFSSVTFLNEKNYASYLSYEGKIFGFINLKSGLRYEHTVTNVRDLNSSVIDRNYGNLFPTIFLGYDVNEDSSLNISFTKRIDRPSFRDMAPFFLYWDENTALTGNPLLQPAFTSNYQLQYSFKGSFIQVSYDDTVDSVSKFQNYFDETRNLLIIYPLNIDLQKTINLQLSIPLNIYSWWSIRPDFLVFNNQVIDDRITEKFNLNINSFRITLTQKFKIDSDTSAEIFSFYQSKTLAGTRELFPFGTLNIAFRKKISSQWSIALNCVNILDTMNRYSTASNSNYYAKSSFYGANPQVNVSASYKFGSKKLKNAKAKKSDATKRLK